MTELDVSAKIAGTFYHGGSSRSHAALLSRQNNECLVYSLDDELLLRQALDQIVISDPIGTLPYRIELTEGAVFETQEHKKVESLLIGGLKNNRFGSQIKQNTWVHRLEQNWRWAIAALFLVPALAFGFLQIAMPSIAISLAGQVPQVIRTELDKKVLNSIDDILIKPSEASDKNTRRLLAAWEKVGGTEGLTLLQRDGRLMGANAFALPGGTVVVTDQLLDALNHEHEIVAVLAHEIGHIHHDHGMRNIIQALAVAAMISTIVGDVSWLSGSILVTAPTMLQQMAYSRDLEREADQFAYEKLRLLDISSSCLGAGLSNLMKAHQHGPEDSDDETERKSKIEKQVKQGGWLDYLSTHPAIEERIAQSGGTNCQ